MVKYKLEFILNTFNTDKEEVKNSLLPFGENLEISEGGAELKINMLTDDPTMIFDICSQFGRIKSAKIDEEEK